MENDDIEIRECEFKDSCSKYSESCFNEYADVCSTRFSIQRALSRDIYDHILREKINENLFLLGDIKNTIKKYNFIFPLPEEKKYNAKVNKFKEKMKDLLEFMEGQDFHLDKNLAIRFGLLNTFYALAKKKKQL